MDRSIKFRAWDTKNKKFPFIGFHIIGECTAFDLINQYRLEELNDLEIQQFTGLLDKNGKEIYEGDILKTSYFSKYIVKFYEGSFVVEINGKHKSPLFNYTKNGIDTLRDLNDKTGLISTLPEAAEVIGNIFENPELLIK